MSRTLRRDFDFVARFVVATVLVSCVSTSSEARTIELTDYDCDRIAVLSPEAPLSGWAATESVAGQFSTSLLDLKVDRVLLMRFPLDRIPAGQRIVRAEWIVPVDLLAGGGAPKLHVRRIIGPWGKGVCHDFRTRVPQPVPWKQPGAKGVATDRAARPTAIVNIVDPGEITINVTEDVELWNTGAAENQGWLVSVEDPAALVRMGSPLWTGLGRYKLRITYEPE